MTVIDSSVILRYLLADSDKNFKKSKEIVEGNSCLVIGEVLCESVRVLERLYKVPRKEISATLIEFLNLENIIVEDIYIKALVIYEREKLDFLEALLCAYKEDFKVSSFNKRVKKC